MVSLSLSSTSSCPPLDNATSLEQWYKEDVRAEIFFFFLHAKHVSTTEIHRQPSEVYGQEAMDRQSVAECCSDFKSGPVGQTDNSQHPTRTKHAFNRQSRLTEEELERDVALAHGTIAMIILSGFHKVCARWVPGTLSDDKAQRKVSAHSTNNIPFMFIISSKAFSLETRRGSSLPGDKLCKLAGSGNMSRPRDRKNSI